MFTTSYTVSHRSVRQYVALVVEGFSSTLAVQNPTHLYSRRDGRVTARAADPRNTLTFSTHRVNVYGILPNGEREALYSRGPKAPEPLADWERDLLGSWLPGDYLRVTGNVGYNPQGRHCYDTDTIVQVRKMNDDGTVNVIGFSREYGMEIPQGIHKDNLTSALRG